MFQPSLRRPLRFLFLERLEDRRTMTSSFGWDGPGQGAAKLTYYLGDTQGEISAEQFKSAIQTALKVWSDVANLTFTQTNTPGLKNSLDFTFQNIDGAGGTLAQAYFPDALNRSAIAGDVQFDTSENWEIGNAQGSSAFDLVYVAVHEIGHALGVDHSSAVDSVMKDSVSAMQSFTKLSTADVDDILALYAAATPTNSGSTSTSTTNIETDSKAQSGAGNTNSGGSATPTAPTTNPNGNWNKNGTNPRTSNTGGGSETSQLPPSTSAGGNTSSGRTVPTSTSNSGGTNAAKPNGSGNNTESSTNDASPSSFSFFTRGGSRQPKFRWGSGGESTLNPSGSRTTNTGNSSASPAATPNATNATSQLLINPQSLNTLLQAMRLLQVFRRWL